MKATKILTEIVSVISALSGTSAGGHYSQFARWGADNLRPMEIRPHGRKSSGFDLASDLIKAIKHVFPYHYDRTWREEDGILHYGIDSEDGTTDWYEEDGTPAGTTSTPSEYEQDENDYRNDGYDFKCPYCRGTGYDPLDGGQCEYCDGLGACL